MNNFNKLIECCKGAVILEINPHRNYHTSVEMYVGGEVDERDVLIKMIELDTVVSVRCYQHTPGGYFTIYHYDIEEAINIALNEVLR